MSEQYDAFISYAHAADARLAPRLQHALQVFAKPWSKRRVLRVFRDEGSLSANPDLWSSIETALVGSRWLILLASPSSASSVWVDREIATWCQHKAPDTILVALTDGDVRWDSGSGRLDITGTTSLPPSAREALKAEPRVIDLRWTRSESEQSLTLRDPRFIAAIADLAAPLHDVPKDELIGEDRRQHQRLRRWRRAAVVALGLLTAVSLVAMLFAFAQRDTARRRAAIAQSRQLASQSKDAADSPALSALLAVEAYRRHATPEAYSALVTAVGRPSLETVFHGEPITGVGVAITSYPNAATFSPDGTLMAASGMRGDVTVWEVETQRPVFALTTSAFTSQLALPTTDRLITYDPGVVLSTWDLHTGKQLNQWVGPPDGTLSADGATILVTSTQNQVVEIWDVASRNRTRLSFPSPLIAAGMRADGKVIGAISGGRLQFFDRTGKATGSVTAPAGIGGDVLVISDDGKRVAAFSESGVQQNPTDVTVTLVDTSNGAAAAVKTSLSSNYEARFSHDGKTFAVTDDLSIVVIDVAGARTTTAIEVGDGLIGLTFNPDGDHLLAPTRSGETYSYRIGVRKGLVSKLPLTGSVAAATPDRSKLAVLSDRSVVVIDAASANELGATIALPALGELEKRTVAIDADGKALAVLTGGSLTAFDAGTGDSLGSAVKIECGWSGAMTFDGRTARIYHAAGVVTTVDVRKARQERGRACPAISSDSFASIDYTGNYAVFGSTSDDQTELTWWDIRRNRTIVDPLLVRGDGPYLWPRVSPGGRFIVTPLESLVGSARVFDVAADPPATGSVTGTPFAEPFSFSDSGTQLAWAQNSRLVLYDLEQRSVIGEIEDLPGEFFGAVFGPGGEWAIAMTNNEGKIGSPALVRVDLRPASLIDEACKLANRNLTTDEQRFYLGSSSSAPACPDYPVEPASPRKLSGITVVSAPVVTATTTSSPSSTRPSTTSSTSSPSSTRPSTTSTTSTTRSSTTTATTRPTTR